MIMTMVWGSHNNKHHREGEHTEVRSSHQDDAEDLPRLHAQHTRWLQKTCSSTSLEGLSTFEQGVKDHRD